MKTVGIVGGLGPESTVDYYQSIISKFQERMGNKEILPELFINSVNMYKVFDLISNDKMEELIHYLVSAIEKLERAGADFAIISGNTPHLVFDRVQQNVQIPMISIVEETCVKARELELNRVGLLGTKFTMENDFFKKPFATLDKEIIVPTSSEQKYIHGKIVEELENGIVKEETKEAFLHIINEMIIRDQLQGIILGCTELPMIIQDDDLHIPQLNTAEIHVNKIIDTIFFG